MFEVVFGVLPEMLLSLLLNTLPNKTIAKIQSFTKIARRISKSLVDRHLDSEAKSKDKGQDLLSLLGQCLSSKVFMER